jgi:hypothetical protein
MGGFLFFFIIVVATLAVAGRQGRALPLQKNWEKSPAATKKKKKRPEYLNKWNWLEAEPH